MVGTYSCQRGTRRWPMKIFFTMLDVGGLNSYIIWRLHHKPTNVHFHDLRRVFLRQVCEELMRPLVCRRSKEPFASQLATHIKTAMLNMGAKIEEPNVPEVEPLALRGRCHFCPGTAKQKTDSRVRC